jgi:L-asparaginase
MVPSDPDHPEAAPSLLASELVPEIRFPCRVDTYDLMTVPGAHLSLIEVSEVARVIVGAAEQEYRGIVVVQGTDTIEETALALGLLVDRDIVIVVTGAMRTASSLGADGPANLADAIIVASDDRFVGLGALVVLNGEIHAAAFVRKSDSVAMQAFTSHPGALGWVQEGEASLWLHPVAWPKLPIPIPIPLQLKDVPEVRLLTAFMGASAQLIEIELDHPSDGLVIEGFGAGHVPPSWVAPLSRLVEDRPVVLCTRTQRGPVLAKTYGFVGSESDLAARGLIRSILLNGAKAAIALQLLILSECDRTAMGDFFLVK